MKPPTYSSTSTSGPDVPRPSPTPKSPPLGDQLALPLTASEFAASQKQIEALHPANRFRLMFGRPLLRDDAPNGPSR